MLDDPALGAGIQHVEDCFRRYMRRSDSNPKQLIGYAARLGNGAVFKRLGFLAERLPEGQFLVREARRRLTSGHAKLDSALRCERLVSRWKLRVPATWLKDKGHD